jgi:hypothetical protein
MRRVLIGLIWGLGLFTYPQGEEVNPVFKDNFDSDPNEGKSWSIYRHADDEECEGYWDEDTKALYLVDSINNLGCAIFADYILKTKRWRVGFKFKVENEGGADGIVFMFYKDTGLYKERVISIGGTLGFTVLDKEEEDIEEVPGYGIEFDIYHNEYDPTDLEHVAVIKDLACDEEAHLEYEEIEDGLPRDEWCKVQIDFDRGKIRVALDGEEVLKYTLKDPDYTHTGVGFAATTGGKNNSFCIDEFQIIDLEGR